MSTKQLHLLILIQDSAKWVLANPVSHSFSGSGECPVSKSTACLTDSSGAYLCGTNGSHWLGSLGRGPVESIVVSWNLMIDDALLHWYSAELVSSNCLMFDVIYTPLKSAFNGLQFRR